MDLEFLLGGGGIIGMTVSGILTHILTKKKYNAETRSAEISNMKETLDFYMKMSDDNKNRLDIYMEANDKLEADNTELKSQNAQLKIQNDKLISQNKELLERIAGLEKKLEQFSKDLNVVKNQKKNGAKVNKKVEKA